MKQNLINSIILKLATVLVATLFLCGCGQEDIKVYTVPKDPQMQMMHGGMPHNHPDISAPSSRPELRWQTPDGWREGPLGQMRAASFRVVGEGGSQADVSVIPLAGGGGGDLGNVNLWRRQLGLEQISEEELKKIATPVEVGGQAATLYELEGNMDDVPVRILGAIQHRDGTAWFFKMTGDSGLVSQQKPKFVQFLQTLQFGSQQAAAQPEPESNDGRPKWKVPSNWKETPGGQFLVAKFIIEGANNAQAAMNVSSSAGDGGGLAANVNRWRLQLGLNELSPLEIEKSATVLPMEKGRAVVVQMRGTDARSGQPAAVVGALVFLPGQSWFYKLMGEPAVVESEKHTFIQFVQEVQY